MTFNPKLFYDYVRRTRWNSTYLLTESKQTMVYKLHDNVDEQVPDAIEPSQHW
jgi:hypothetical protein